jgi:hypothetical protein
MNDTERNSQEFLSVFLTDRKAIMKNIVSFMFLAMLLFVGASCITAGVPKGSTTDLAETVAAFYELKIQGRFDDAWNYERMSTDHDENRKANARKLYLTNSSAGIALRDFEVIAVGDEGSGIEGLTPVKIKLITDWPPLPFATPKGDRVLVMEDFWEKIDGKWFHVVRGATKLW